MWILCYYSYVLKVWHDWQCGLFELLMLLTFVLLFLRLDDLSDILDSDDLKVGLEPCECDDYDKRSGFYKLLILLFFLLLLLLILVSTGVDCGDDKKFRLSLYLLLLLLLFSPIRTKLVLLNFLLMFLFSLWQLLMLSLSLLMLSLSLWIVSLLFSLLSTSATTINDLLSYLVLFSVLANSLLLLWTIVVDC